MVAVPDRRTGACSAEDVEGTPATEVAKSWPWRTTSLRHRATPLRWAATPPASAPSADTPGDDDPPGVRSSASWTCGHASRVYPRGAFVELVRWRRPSRAARADVLDLATVASGPGEVGVLAGQRVGSGVDEDLKRLAAATSEATPYAVHRTPEVPSASVATSKPLTAGRETSRHSRHLPRWLRVGGIRRTQPSSRPHKLD